MSVNLADPRPVYRQIADQLRADILSGTLQPGSMLPSLRALTETYGVALMTVRQAIDVLKTEGLVDAEHGRGVMVRRPAPLRRVSSDRYSRARRAQGQTPFMADTEQLGPPTFEKTQYGPQPAGDRIAGRLRIKPDAKVLVQGLRFHAGSRVMQTSTAYLPWNLVDRTWIVDPERQAWNTDTVSNLASVGVQVDEVTEQIQTRPAHADEAITFGLRPGTPVFTVVRTMHAAGKAVETCDIVMPGDRYELAYRVPVD